MPIRLFLWISLVTSSPVYALSGKGVLRPLDLSLIIQWEIVPSTQYEVYLEGEGFQFSDNVLKLGRFTECESRSERESLCEFQSTEHASGVIEIRLDPLRKGVLPYRYEIDE